MDLVSLFNSIRDIPYEIPLGYGEEDNCCSGKHAKLLYLLKQTGCGVRYRVCVSNWDSLNLPIWLEKISPKDDCIHSYLEINLDGIWKSLDATWDKKLGSVFKINNWDGESETEIGLKPIHIFSPKVSFEIMNNQDEKLIIDDLKVNGDFYRGFNNWLRSIRIQEIVKKYENKFNKK